MCWYNTRAHRLSKFKAEDSSQNMAADLQDSTLCFDHVRSLPLPLLTLTPLITLFGHHLMQLQLQHEVLNSMGYIAEIYPESRPTR